MMAMTGTLLLLMMTMKVNSFQASGEKRLMFRLPLTALTLPELIVYLEKASTFTNNTDDRALLAMYFQQQQKRYEKRHGNGSS
jgi:hypothetical protein